MAQPAPRSIGFDASACQPPTRIRSTRATFHDTWEQATVPPAKRTASAALDCRGRRRGLAAALVGEVRSQGH